MFRIHSIKVIIGVVTENEMFCQHPGTRMILNGCKCLASSKVKITAKATAMSQSQGHSAHEVCPLQCHHL